MHPFVYASFCIGILCICILCIQASFYIFYIIFKHLQQIQITKKNFFFLFFQTLNFKIATRRDSQPETTQNFFNKPKPTFWYRKTKFVNRTSRQQLVWMNNKTNANQTLQSELHTWTSVYNLYRKNAHILTTTKNFKPTIWKNTNFFTQWTPTIAGNAKGIANTWVVSGQRYTNR